MNKSISGILALLLAAALLLAQAGCAQHNDTEESQAPQVIFVPDPELQSGSGELGTPLADVRVRQALAHAIDLDTVKEALLGDSAQTAVSRTAAGDWLDADVTGLEYDPELAKELLAEAGWPSSYVLDVVYAESDPLTADLLNVIGGYWDAVGVKAEFRKLEGDVAAQLWTAPEDAEGDSAVEWDLAYVAAAPLTEPESYGCFASTASDNSHTPAIEGLDDLIAQMKSAREKPERKRLLGQIQQILAENVSFIPLFHQNIFVCTSDHLDTAGANWGDDSFAYDKNILNWITDREDETLYTVGGPMSYFEMPAAEPGKYLYQELVFERLLNADSSLEPTEGQIAESYTLSDDGKTLEFTLREGLAWHDGEKLTAEDVKFTFELYMRCPETGTVLAGVLDGLAGAEDYRDYVTEECTGITVEGNKVTFCFDEAAPDVLKIFAQWPILPRHKLENADPERLQRDRFWRNPVGSGPYRVAEVEPGDYCVLERWDGYRETGAGNIHRIYMASTEDACSDAAVYAAMDRLDYGWGSSVDDRNVIAGLEGMQVTQVPAYETSCFFINQYPHESYAASQLAEAEATAPTE